TTPAQVSSVRSISPASSTASWKSRWAPGTCRKVEARTRATSARPGTAATRSSALSFGTTPPPPPGVIAIVPPRAITAMSGWFCIPHMSYHRSMLSGSSPPAEPLFEPGRVGNLEVRNRIVRAGTSETMADERGAVTDQYLALYEELARNDVGL